MQDYHAEHKGRWSQNKTDFGYSWFVWRQQNIFSVDARLRILLLQLPRDIAKAEMLVASFYKKRQNIEPPACSYFSRAYLPRRHRYCCFRFCHSCRARALQAPARHPGRRKVSPRDIGFHTSAAAEGARAFSIEEGRPPRKGPAVDTARRREQPAHARAPLRRCAARSHEALLVDDRRGRRGGSRRRDSSGEAALAQPRCVSRIKPPRGCDDISRLISAIRTKWG